MSIKTFWIGKTRKVTWRYISREPGDCPIHGGQHRAESEPFVCMEDEKSPGLTSCPAHCGCGHAFGPKVGYGCGKHAWVRLDTGEEVPDHFPVGALYVARTANDQNKAFPPFGFDGLSIACVLPGGHHWRIDSRASNCTLPNDTAHRCWVRHGTYGEQIHVDKQGNTCNAGAGSIVVDGWHGFLHHGELTAC